MRDVTKMPFKHSSYKSPKGGFIFGEKPLPFREDFIYYKPYYSSFSRIFMSIRNAGTETLDRIKKLERIRALGVNPFATRFAVSETIADLLKKHPPKIDEGTLSPFRVIDEIIQNPTENVALA
jgi:hypothetical protein